MTTTAITIKNKEINMSTTHLADQLQAANSHQARIQHAASALYGAGSRYGPLPPFARQLLATLADRLISARVGLCVHLSPSAPSPAFWFPYASGKLRCGPCSARLYKRIRGTNVDWTCDRCRRFDRTVRWESFSLPGVMIDMGQVGMDDPLSIPPLTISYGLCRSCVAAESA